MATYGEVSKFLSPSRHVFLHPFFSFCLAGQNQNSRPGEVISVVRVFVFLSSFVVLIGWSVIQSSLSFALLLASAPYRVLTLETMCLKA